METSSLSSAALYAIPSSLTSPRFSTTQAFFSPGYPPRRSLFIRSRPTQKRGRGLVCNSLFGLGVPELAVIAGVAALVFGPKQLPEIGRTLGKSIKGFQQAAKEFEQELKKPEEGEITSGNPVEAKPVSENTQEQENVVSSSKESS